MKDGVFLSTSDRSVMGDSSVSASKNTAVSKSQSLHMLLYVYSRCHGNVAQVPPFSTFTRMRWHMETPRHNDGFIEHKRKGEPTIQIIMRSNISYYWFSLRQSSCLCAVFQLHRLETTHYLFL